MTLQETIQHLPPAEREPLHTFFALLHQHLSPTDWERLQTALGALDPERRLALLTFIARRETHAPAVGAEAPDFDLPRLGSHERVRLASFRCHQPVALIFGSFT